MADETPSDEPAAADNGNGGSSTENGREGLKNASEWCILLISLAEGLFTTFFFDDDKFDFLIVAGVFGAFTFFDNCAKALVSSTKPRWDDLVVGLLSEGSQAYLYLFFCSFSNISLVWIPVMGGAQAFLVLVIFCCTPTWVQRDPSVEGNRLCQWLNANIMGILAVATPIPYLLTQSESPFNTKQFEVLLTVYFWVGEVVLRMGVSMTKQVAILNARRQQQQQQLEGAQTPPSKDDQEQNIDEEKGGGEAEPKGGTDLNDPNPEAASLGCQFLCYFLLIFAQIAFVIYLFVLGWMWGLDPEMEDTYDKVVTMIMMVGSAASAFCCCCAVGCFCLLGVAQ